MERIVLKEPYFLSNKEWYYYDYELLRYFLTDKATPEAINSYNEFYKEIDKEPAE